jgi:putative heme-binding domain-containing protein
MRRIMVGSVCALVLLTNICAVDLAEQEKINTAVDALTRLQDIHLDEKPAVKAAVERVLEKTRGTPNFVKLVRHFKLTNQNAGLLEAAINNPKEESGVEAVRLVLANKDLPLVEKTLQTTNVAEAARLVEALGNAKEKQSVPLIAPFITDDSRDLGARRAAVRALAQTQDGAWALLTMAKEDKLPENLKFIAASELNGARWPEIKSEAAKVIPLPAAQNSQPLPPVSELVRMKGSPPAGAEIFRRDTTACIKCHQVRGEGREVGPALTEIGTKLPKEALIESILDPSAGISFGFEGWQVELKSGDDVYGIKASDTPEEVAIKDANGIITRYKKSEIASMRQAKTSIMPTGLQQTISTQEFVDLIEYLSSLKKAQP